MRIALGQFAVVPDWKVNLSVVLDYARRAVAAGADLLVVPENVLASDPDDPGLGRREAQLPEGPFLSGLIAGLRDTALTVAGCIPVPEADGRVSMTLFVVSRDGILALYKKLHLYDAFSTKESDYYTPGDDIPPVVTIGGVRTGLMICYDVRFPEMARRLVLDGAELLLVPAAWVRGPLKEHHWEVMATARALENTCYVAAVGECGPRNIGSSMLIDPLGVAVVRAGCGPDLLVADVSSEHVASVRRSLPVLVNRRFSDPGLR
ncbi:deaminated glutathione amidase [Acetobacter sp. AN02]|uniref:deaminated glutathione amidase n=1 Tax=Acetobacter sp. AN02 TaxID=2894186 RepID=UPI002434565B|nr:deaminated glutathione amidase [Acetobacter sp. AN02]MDG6094361.1 deaminated glutathione amidase [Acetobacter sp. AN02]